jgi:hypothetical protein
MIHLMVMGMRVALEAGIVNALKQQLMLWLEEIAFEVVLHQVFHHVARSASST